MLKRKGLLSNNLGRFFISLGFSTLMIVVLSFVFALVAGKLTDPTKNLAIFSFAALLISAAAGGIFSARISEGKLSFSLLSSAAVLLIMLIVCIIANGGKIPASAFMNYGCYMGVYLLSSLLGKGSGKRRRHRR